MADQFGPVTFGMSRKAITFTTELFYPYSS